jgi:hypothetical protein
LEERAVGQIFFSGGYEEDGLESACHSRLSLYRQAACHNNPRIVNKISDSSKRLYVKSRKKTGDV